MYLSKLIQFQALQQFSARDLEQSLQVQLFDVSSEQLASTIPVSVLAPTPVEGEELPVFIHLDGGVGDRTALVKRRRLVADMIAAGVIPRSLHVSFSGGATEFYQDKWEQWICTELPNWVSDKYTANTDSQHLVLTGISVGGYGTLKVGFKFPNRFKAIAAMEPVIMPSLTWPAQHTRASWWMLESSAVATWGQPFPESYLANHPPNLALANAELINESDMSIYLEVGDEDMLNLQDGAEFLHRVLWDCDIAHEYHQVRWADHGGSSLDDRFVEAMAFLAAALAGGKRQPRDLPLTNSEQDFVDYFFDGGPMRGEAPPQGASQGTGDRQIAVMSRLWQPLKEIAETNDVDMLRRYGRMPKN